jgi:hypothetical protein
MIFDAADRFVGAIVNIRRIRPHLPLLGRVAEVLVLGARRHGGVAVELRLLDGFLRPLPREDVVGLALAVQQVHRHLRELERGPALEEENLVIRRDREQLAQVGLGLVRDRDELRAAVAHLHHRHAAAVPVEHLVAGARQHFGRQHGRARAEVENPGHRELDAQRQ